MRLLFLRRQGKLFILEVDSEIYASSSSDDKCVSMQIKSIKYYLPNITSNGKITNKKFRKAIKPFPTNKSCLENSDIM